MIQPTTQDIQTISDDLVEQILAHNCVGAKMGCWEMPKNGCAD